MPIKKLMNLLKKSTVVKEDSVTVDTFADFCKNTSYLWLREATADVGGGTISIDDIDRLKEYPNTEVISISGLNQETFEYFIKTYGKQFKAIRFFKNKLVEDWSLLGELPNLEFVYWFFNQRITSFWDMHENISLKGLAIDDFSRLKSLEMIETAPSLEHFSIGNAMWPKAVIDSFKPVAKSKLKKIEFWGAKVLDTDFSFILDMPHLREFNFHPTLLTTEQVAWIVAKRPDLKGESLCPAHIDIKSLNSIEWKRVYVTGKGKRSFDLDGNEKRLEKLETEFQALVQKYRSSP